MYHAEDGLAISEDLLHWTKVSEPVLRHGDNGAYDNHHAHKPSVFTRMELCTIFFIAERVKQIKSILQNCLMNTEQFAWL